MNDLPRQKLIEIVAKHGKSIVEDARRAEALFRDNFGEFRREIAVLKMAVEEGVARDLATAPANSPRGVLIARLTQRLVDNLALSKSAAGWAVNAWAEALGVVSNAGLETPAQQNFEKPQTNAAQSPPAIQNQPPQNRNQANAVIVVSANDDGDFISIGEAIEAAADGAKISVRPGLYDESLTINKQIEIVGDGEPKDIIVRSGNNSVLSMKSERAVVRNLTLQCLAGESGKRVFGVDVEQGELLLQNCDLTSNSLACIAVHGVGANPLIQNCLVRDGADVGIYFFDSAAGTIEQCDVFRNRNSGVVIAENSNPNIRNCRIFAGENAGFLVSQNGLGTIDDCEIYGHQAPEVVASLGGSPVLRGCRIHNSNDAGVFVQNNGSALLENCSIYENRNAGISVDGASIAAIRNCRINQNETVAVSVKGESSVRVENSDLTRNRLATWETEENVFVENINNREF